MSFLMPSLIVGSVDSTPVFEGSTAFAEMGMLLPVRRRVHAFVSDVGSFSVTKASEFDYGQSYQVYSRGHKMNWANETCVEWLTCMQSSGDVLDI